MTVPIIYKGVIIDKAFRLDLMIEGVLPVELKSTERHSAVHSKQLLTYLRILQMPLGLLMNFGLGTFRKVSNASPTITRSQIVERNVLTPQRLSALA